MRFLAILALFLLTGAPAHARYFGGGAPATVGPSCPDDDGSSGASPGAANYPTLLTGGNPAGTTYAATINGTHGLGCKVAGVDYQVGLPSGTTLSDPRSATLPSGCSYDGSKYVHCTGSGTITGLDFSLGAPTLLTTSGTWTVTANNFTFGADCTDPVINASGTLTLTKNTVDGTAGKGCNLSGGFGTFINVNIGAGGSFTAKYNALVQIAQDAFDMAAPSSGTETTTIKYNLGYLQGTTGHPDFIQYCGGGAGVLSPNQIGHNTWFSYLFSGISQGVQPFHVEAQTCNGVGHLANSTESFNTIISQGACNHGTDYPTGCSVNWDMACKQDDTSTNVNFAAYGNYIDASGAVNPLINAYGCPSTTWGSPYSNYDMITGTTLTTNP